MDKIARYSSAIRWTGIGIIIISLIGMILFPEGAPLYRISFIIGLIGIFTVLLSILPFLRKG